MSLCEEHSALYFNDTKRLHFKYLFEDNLCKKNQLNPKPLTA